MAIAPNSKDITMVLTTSAKGKLEIISHEAIVLCPYRDSVGVWTWGVGAHGADDRDRNVSRRS
jgi:GH24 family phage-related lysozyme (muramidase)